MGERQFPPIGEAVRRIREGAGVSQAELARRAKVSRPTISRLESSADDDISLKLLRTIADTLGVSITAFLHEYVQEGKDVSSHWVHYEGNYRSIQGMAKVLFGPSSRYYEQLGDDEKELARLLGLVASEFVKARHQTGGNDQRSED